MKKRNSVYSIHFSASETIAQLLRLKRNFIFRSSGRWEEARMTQILGFDSADGYCIITGRGSRRETCLGGSICLVLDTLSF